jgi:3-hydroxy-9,10-secoandrosta-1,3,5(10)-triene-9,17-dione monooxygenase
MAIQVVRAKRLIQFGQKYHNGPKVLNPRISVLRAWSNRYNEAGMKNIASMNAGEADSSSAPAISTEWLLDQARAMAMVLRDRATETSEARRVPTATIDDFWKADLFHLFKPKKFGGPEVAADVIFQIAGILGEGDGSAAWVWNLLNMHDLFVAHLPLEAQEQYWQNHNPLGASSFAANGRAAAVRGGFKLTGKWSFCSGVDNADWMLLGAKCEGAISETRWVLVPKSECRVIDDWHVLGLCGTGSKSVAVEDVFVPEHRTVRYEELVSGQSPGGKLHANPIYRAPLWTIFTLGICAPALGVARGACASFIREMRTRVYGENYAQQAKNPTIQMRVAEATAMADAADLLYQRALKETIQQIMAGETPTPEDRLRSRRDQGYAVQQATKAVDLLLGAQGGRGLHHGSHIQRAMRDLHAISAHLMAGWDMPALAYGQFILGGEVATPYY